MILIIGYPCKNSTGIAAEFCRYSSGEIPGGIRMDSADSTGIIAGIPEVFLRNSGLTAAECRVNSSGIPAWNSAGIIASIPPEFCRIPSRNSAGITAGIPSDSILEFRRNNLRHFPGIPSESIQEFRWKGCRHSPGLHLGIPPELLPPFSGYPSQSHTYFLYNYGEKGASNYETLSAQTFELRNIIIYCDL